MKPAITGIKHTQPTAANNDGSIVLSGLKAGTAYTAHFKKNGTDVSVNVTTDEEGNLVLGGLDVGKYDNFYVVDDSATEDNQSDVHTGGISLFTHGGQPAQTTQSQQGPGLTNKSQIQNLLYSYFANTHGGDPKQDVKNAATSLITDLKTLKGDQKETCEILKLLYPDIISNYGSHLEQMVTDMQNDFLNRLGDGEGSGNVTSGPAAEKK